ncbi:FAD-dependent oxidoreductase [Novosphingobium sp.]|uniref:FAD-dependent oxidoreductase n=1 Tax=Novosphingobium sp. TaxID=1874826 RepID=UPI0038B83A87
MAVTLRVAIVGAGPSGLYAAGHLLESRDPVVEVDFIERLPTPWGLVRSGVAPDHGEKKRIIERLFDFILRHERVRFFGNTAVGKDVGVAELAQWYDAVIYAHGAGGHNAIGIPGEDLAGVRGARDFVQFYNGHPDQAHLQFDLSHPRAVIVGNGNVAVDIARILTADVDDLAKTDIADHALDALRASKVKEVVIMGRRDLEFAAFNNPELEEFQHLEDVEVLVDGEFDRPRAEGDPVAAWRALRRYDIMRDLISRPRSPTNKRVVFQFLAAPVAIRGDQRVQRVDFLRNRVVRDDAGLRYEPGSDVQSMEAGLVLSACGYRGRALAGLPFDDALGVVPHRGGRIVDDAGTRSGEYVTGWIKRGCRGIIGSNRKCARETVAALLADFAASRLRPAAFTRDLVVQVLSGRNPAVVHFDNWRAIDRREQVAGRVAGRPRVKLATVDALLGVAFSGHSRSAAGREADNFGVS